MPGLGRRAPAPGGPVAAVLFAEDAKDAGEKAGKIAEARISFEQARRAYGKAVELLEARDKSFGAHIPDNDPRRKERDKAHDAFLNALLQKACVN